MDIVKFFQELPSTGEVAPLPKGQKTKEGESFNDICDYCEGDCGDGQCKCDD